MEDNTYRLFFITLCKKYLPLSVRHFLNYFRNKINFYTFKIQKQGFLNTSKEILPLFFYNLCGLFFSIPAVIIILILMPIVKIRLVRLLSERLGHFCLNTEIMLCAFDEGALKKEGNGKVKYLFYTHSVISNLQLLILWKRIFPVLPAPVICAQINKILSFISTEYRNDPLKKTVENGDWADDRLRLMERVPQPHVFFTPEEERQGTTLMHQLNLTPNTKYVCLAARDSLYLEKLFPGANWRYHDYRNADIMSYKKAALFLAEKGYAVIRMGKWVADHFDVSHPLVIDYANHPLRSDFLDIYLPSKCQFFMSTSTGIDAVPQLFRRPLLFSNVGLPSALQFYSQNGLFIPKKIGNKRTGKLLTFNEIHKILSTHQTITPEFFIDNDLELINNTEDEILALTKEMEQRLTGVWKETVIDQKEQKQFLNEYCSPYVKNNIDIRVKVGADFLKRNSQFLLSCTSTSQAATTHDIQ